MLSAPKTDPLKGIGRRVYAKGKTISPPDRPSITVHAALLVTPNPAVGMGAKRADTETKSWKEALDCHKNIIYVEKWWFACPLHSGPMNEVRLPQYLDGHDSPNRIALLRDVCIGLEFIHKSGLVHGDVRASNIVVTSDGRAMICDFGHRADMRQLALDESRSLRWLSPERGCGRCTNGYKSDVWAFGMLIYEVLSGKVPYEDCKNLVVLLSAVREGKEPPQVPAQSDTGECYSAVWKISTRCLHKDPNSRADMSQLSLLFGDDLKLEIDKRPPTPPQPPSPPPSPPPQEPDLDHDADDIGCCGLLISRFLRLPKARLARVPDGSSSAKPTPSADITETQIAGPTTKTDDRHQPSPNETSLPNRPTQETPHLVSPEVRVLAAAEPDRDPEQLLAKIRSANFKGADVRPMTSDMYMASILIHHPTPPPEHLILKALALTEISSKRDVLRERVTERARSWLDLGEHPNLVPCFGAIGRGEEIYLVYPEVKWKSLKVYLKETPGADLAQMVSDTLSGLSHLHAHGVIHGDVRTDRIHVREGAGGAQVLLSDFSLTEKFEEFAAFEIHANSSIRWWSPEVIQPEDDTDVLKSLSSDMWAFSLMVYEILAGKVPYHAIPISNLLALIRAILDKENPLSELENGSFDSDRREILDIAIQCGAKDRFKRLTSAEAHARLQKFLSARAPPQVENPPEHSQSDTIIERPIEEDLLKASQLSSSEETGDPAFRGVAGQTDRPTTESVDSPSDESKPLA